MAMVKRFDFGVGTACFELLEQNEDDHHHHLVCCECTSVVEIGECFSEIFEQRIALEHGFAGVSHRLKFFRLCPDCQAT